MPPPWNRDEEDRPQEEDEDDEIGEYDYKSHKDAVLFAIEVNDSMLKEHDDPNSKDTDSAVMAALKSASMMMQQRIISQPKDMMGIMFFGTKKTKFRESSSGSGSGNQYPNCYLHTDLEIPSAEVVKALKDMAFDGDDPNDVLVPSGTEAPIKSMLFSANQIFTTGAPNFGSRRLFIVTDNDDPFNGDKTKRDQAAVRAKDLFDLGVTIDLFPVSSKDHKFDVEKFYTDLIYLDPLQAVDPESADEIKAVKAGEGMSLLQSLTSNIISKQSPKRAYFSRMPFELAPGMTISVSGYLLMHRQKIERTCYVYLEKDNDQPKLAQGEVTKTEEGSLRTVEKGELKKAYKFGTGGDYIYFTPQELETVKKFEKDKCLRVIGFKPRSMLPPWAAVKKSLFIFPTETDYIGSTRVFSALWQTLLKSKKMAIAWYVSRKNAVPQIVAILPSKKQSDESSGTRYLPAGLWLHPLPFVDDCRDLESIKPQTVVRASEELVDKMRTIVGQLKLPKDQYDPGKYPNPALQHHYKVLQLIALDEYVNDQKQVDHTKPRHKQIHQRVGQDSIEFKTQLDEEAQFTQHEMDIKRDIEEEDADERPKKKARTVAKKSVGGTTLADLSAEIADGTLQKRTNVDLKAICQEKGLTTSGKKADLLERLEQWVERSS